MNQTSDRTNDHWIADHIIAIAICVEVAGGIAMIPFAMWLLGH